MSQELTIPDKDGFDMARTSARVIQGSILKHVDGRGSVDGAPFADDRELMVMDVAEVAQCFMNDTHVESVFVAPDNPVDIDTLNGNIPKKDWKIGLSGQPEPPWRLSAAVYLLDENTGERFTMINSTYGIKRAVEDLISRVQVTRKLRGSRVIPIVTIGAAPMKTKWGTKMRPSFIIKGWKGPAAEQSAPLLMPVAPPTAAEIVQDEIPDHPAPKKAKAKKDFPRPASMQEDPSDSIPF